MRRDPLLRNMLSAGLDSVSAEKALDAGFNLTSLRAATKTELLTALQRWEVERVQQLLQRAPIADDVVQRLIEACDWACSLCWNIDELRPIIIHHIEEHAKGGDDSYDNLVILCLNHHGVAHSQWKFSRHPAPSDYIANRRREFEAAIAEFKAGKRAAPGREGNGSDPRSQSDVAALKIIAQFLSRPAVFRPFEIEGNMHDFLVAMSDVIRALNTGVLKTREGDDLGRVKPVRQFSNPEWSERLDLVCRQFDTLRARVEFAIRQGELQVRPESGFYVLNNRDLTTEIDAMRWSAVSMLNPILRQANIPPLRGPELPGWATWR